MRTHPYLRAYMAGIVVPTIFLLIAPIVFALERDYRAVITANEFRPLALVQLAIFPGALVPNLWGLWNILHLHLRRSLPRLSLAAFGALIPLVLVPLVYWLGPAFFRDAPAIWVVIPVGMATYYLVWKFAVGYLNQEMGIA